MPEAREPRSIIEAAEQAAAAGNYAAAEELLREAALLQEKLLGRLHPDLANTLNNLGVVCEITDNPIDAEHYFRRAFAIATAALAPNHPFVGTSRKNLHDFCEVRGRPVELPPSSPAVAAWLDAPEAAAEDRPRESQSAAKSPAIPPIVRKRSLSALAVGALSVIALLIVSLTLARAWRSPAGKGESSSTIATAPPREGPARPPAPSAVEPITREPLTTTTRRSEPDAVSASRMPAGKTSATPTMVTAQLCTTLEAWRCEPAGAQAAPGSFFFYTQIKSNTATTIQHRWYRGDRLHQSVLLRIQANPGVGYRTYSRTTISSERAGSWRVELRTEDGAVLHEERFTVR
jgi:hypothetical protein